MHSPVFTIQILHVRSIDPEMHRSPSKLNCVDEISPRWPDRVCRHCPVQSQTLVVWSKEPVMILSPLVLKLRETISAVCPISVAISSPVATLHSLAVESMDPVATISPAGQNARHTISVVCPRRVCSSSPVFASQILAVLSNEPVTTLSPNGLLNAIAYTTFLWPSSVS